MLESLTSQSFDGLVGGRFEVVPTHGHPFVMVLSECLVSDHMLPAGLGMPVQRTPFSLIFHAPRDALVPQQICRVRNAGFGELPLFLVPLGPDERGMRYQAVIS